MPTLTTTLPPMLSIAPHPKSRWLTTRLPMHVTTTMTPGLTVPAITPSSALGAKPTTTMLRTANPWPNVSTMTDGATALTSATPPMMHVALTKHAASHANMPGGVYTPAPLTYASFTLKGPNKGVMSWPGHGDQVIKLLFSLPDCWLFFLDWWHHI
jgi:hypothetical protein